MKVIVTGGAGYIGSICAAELLANGHEVIVVDNLYQGHRAAVPPEAIWHHADLGDAAQVAGIFRQHRGIDGVLHFASYTLVGESMQQPFRYLRDNLVAGANLFEHAVASREIRWRMRELSRDIALASCTAGERTLLAPLAALLDPLAPSHCAKAA